MAGAAAAGRPTASPAVAVISAHPHVRRTAATPDCAFVWWKAECCRTPGACLKREGESPPAQRVPVARAASEGAGRSAPVGGEGDEEHEPAFRHAPSPAEAQPALLIGESGAAGELGNRRGGQPAGRGLQPPPAW